MAVAPSVHYSLPPPTPAQEQTDGLGGPASLEEQLLAVQQTALKVQAAARAKLVVATSQVSTAQQQLQRLKEAGAPPMAAAFKSRQVVQKAEKVVLKAGARSAELFNVMCSARGLAARAAAAPWTVQQQHIMSAVEVAEAELLAAQQHAFECSSNLQLARLQQLSHLLVSTAIIAVAATGEDTSCWNSYALTTGVLAVAITTAREAKRVAVTHSIAARKANAASGHAFNYLAGVRSVTARRRQGENIPPHPLEVMLTHPDYEGEFLQAQAAHQAAVQVEQTARDALMLVQQQHGSVLQLGRQHSAAIEQQLRRVSNAQDVLSTAEQELSAADTAVDAAARDVAIAQHAKGIAPAVVSGAKHTIVQGAKSFVKRIKVMAVLSAIARVL